MSEKGFRVEIPVHIKRDRRARKGPAQGETPKVDDSVPRFARLLALAHKWEGMVRRGQADYAQLARRHGISLARVSQICSLTLLAPQLQEALLGEQAKPNTPTRATLRSRAFNPVWSEQCEPSPWAR